MLAWILGFLLVPVFGVILYFLIGERKVRRRARRKRKRRVYILQALHSEAWATEKEDLEFKPKEPGPLDLDPSLLKLAEVSEKLGDFPLSMGNKVEIFTSAREIYGDLLRAIDGAKHHVHLEYYIFRPDETGRLFRDLLVKKAKAGVEVRLLLDGIGSWGTWWSFLRPLIDAGGLVETFLPAVPLRSRWHINCRNHRKIVLIDGEVAFLGSQNIGDEYRGRLRRLGPWSDTHLRIEGPAARELQEVFVEDWYFASREDLVSSKYLRRQPAKGDSMVQIVPSGPDQDEGVLQHILFSAISLAQKSIRIGTPYFVPDPGLILALQHAAFRGIKVEVLIPSRTDSRLVLWAGRSFYQELIRSGVRIHEFDHGMLHSKTVSIDDRWSLIGSANMDVRSFLLNFEVTASVFDEKISKKLADDFGTHLEESREISPCSNPPGPFFASLLEGAARLFTPLL